MAVTETVEIALEVPISASLSVIAPRAHPIFEIDPSPSAAVRKRNSPVIFGQKHPGPASGKLTGP
ncbi:hypothetical protein, partial [uncultured Parasutterella sp.]|uniref:hypothetical protein n=1 Tax=uncultured Parasutterella sp. TaxID=1263098 RepID=UPI00272C5A80